MASQPLPTFEQFAAVRRYGGNTGFSMAWSPDSTEIAYVTNITGQFNLWKQSASGGYPVQLTFFTDRSARNMAWSPDGQTILFNADIDGNEMHQLFTIPANGGTPTQLTDVKDATHLIGPGAFSPDGRTIAYGANDLDRRNLNVVMCDMQTGEVTRLISDEGNFFPAEWSPDGQNLLCVQARFNSDSDIILVNMADRTAQTLTTHEGEINYGPGPWAREKGKRGFYFTSNESGEHHMLGYYNLKSGRRKWVVTPEWDVEGARVSRDGRYLAWAVNEDGYSHLRVRDLKKDKMAKLAKMPDGVIAFISFAPDGKKIVLLMGGASFCVQPFVLSLKPKQWIPLTASMLGGVDPQTMVEPELIRFETFDGRQVPAWLYQPRGVMGKAPVVLSVHGGPEAQERPVYAYSGLYQYWLSRGIGVLATNIRGSTGYGKSYQQLIRRDWGGGELKDQEYAVKYLHSLDWVDPQRIGFFGGSFGGFSCLSCVSRLPDLWAAAVGWFGPSNLITFVKSVPPWWRRYMKGWVGDPDEDRDLLIERSPITYVGNVKTPLYIIQGANDPRVVKAESDQFVEKLRERGVPVQYDVYNDEGHGFTKRANELKALKDSAEFLEQRLLG
ncbi:MAG: S9 family peptidase [Chloroflexi bacterium]|nr:S9 family peptidase [Chloroflexota bacterium]